MWFHLSSHFLWEDVGFSCESKNEKAVIPKQRLKTKPCPSPQPVGLWKGVCCYLGTCEPGFGEGALPLSHKLGVLR